MCGGCRADRPPPRFLGFCLRLGTGRHRRRPRRPDVKFHSSKLNYKWPGSGEVVKWHRDIPAWPHTNYSPVTLGVYLCDVPAERGPLTCVAGSHLGPISSTATRAAPGPARSGTATWKPPI